MVKVLEVLELPKSTFYYKPIVDSGLKKGRLLSSYTKTLSGEFISNQQVVDYIIKILGEEFVDYGYLKVTHCLRQDYSCIINPKKVYNLMKMNALLNISPKRSLKVNRQWVQELVPNPALDFSYLEFDIKYFYVKGMRRNAMVLSVIDVKSRWLLGQLTAWKIKEQDVKELFDKIFSIYSLPEKIYVRNDNGSQFAAHSVQKYFKESKKPFVTQEFTKPATPEQNAHIESYHSITERVICQRYQFDNLQELKDTLERFESFYNFRRIHSSLNYLSPYKNLLQKGIDMLSDPSKKFFKCVPNAS
jgi:putative transposase